MMNGFGFLRPRPATITLILLASMIWPAALHAQQTYGPSDTAGMPPPGSEAIGPPQLREFELPGTRIVPARPTVNPPATAAPPVQVPAPPIAAPAPPPAAPAERAAPRQAPTATTPGVAPGTGPAVSRTAPQTVVPNQAMVQPRVMPGREPTPLAPPSSPAVPPPYDLDVPPAPGPTFSWAYALGIVLAAALVGLLLFYRRRRNAQGNVAFQIVGGKTAAPEPPPLPRKGAEPAEPVAPPSAPAAPPPAPADADPPAFLVRSSASAARIASPASKDGLVGIEIRPWLQLEFRPDRATATDTEATVQFELIIANTGNVPAANVRLDARMFNAGPQLKREIASFFAAPIPDRSGAAMPAIPARSATSLRSRVSMPKHLMREIEVGGRRLFIPTVAINVCYDWGTGKTGRTSMSFLVGREPEDSSSKMGPFRLDQGPRVYRQVGQRLSQPAVLV